MDIEITDIHVLDIRYPTSRLDMGSDAMHPDPDYSATYVILHTNKNVEGHGLSFTLGRGNELCVAAVKSLSPLLVGRSLKSIRNDMAGFWRSITSESQLRWLGPEKGVIHLATAALVNAVWDLYAKVEGKPLWKLLADMSPEELVSCIDFRYITDVLTPEEAEKLLAERRLGHEQRESLLNNQGYPAYTTSIGWLGYSEEKIVQLCRSALEQGWNNFKIKVGSDLEEDVKRAALVRNEIGPDRLLMMDANQRWEVEEAIEWIEALKPYDPFWIEEPTSPDDILGHKTIRAAVSPIGIATGEQCSNRVMFKQLMQSQAIDFCQIDSCRLGGVNEILSVLLMAAKFEIPVCPHAGGVGLCEYVQHLSIFDFLCVSTSLENRFIEYVDHLHSHFVDPVKIRNSHYIPPSTPGYSITMKASSLERFRFPDGTMWC